VEGLHRLNLDREKVLDRLWEIANLSPEMTRGSITGQVKALSMIIAMQNFIPDPRAVASEKKSVPAPTQPQISAAACPPSPATAQQDGPAHPACPGEPWSAPWKPKHAPVSAGEAPPDPGPNQSTLANRFSPSEAPKPYVPLFASVPDLGVGFPIKNPFVHPR
jgi:hypothetical protein